MKRFLFALLNRSRAIRLVAWLNRRKVTILCYHSVIGNQPPPRHDPHKQHIPLPLFLEHLDHLQRNYRVISLVDFLQARRENRRLPDYSVVLTFDDGFSDFSTLVTGTLAQRQLPATVFVITERTYGRLPPNGESFLSWPDVQELAASGIQVGSHTCTHPRLLDLPLDEVRKELADSRAAILDHITQADVPLSYPHGLTSEPISELVETLGYSCGLTSMLGPNGDQANLYALSRTVIASDDDVATFAARVSGLTWWAARFRKFFNFKPATELAPDVLSPEGSWRAKISNWGSSS